MAVSCVALRLRDQSRLRDVACDVRQSEESRWRRRRDYRRRRSSRCPSRPCQCLQQRARAHMRMTPSPHPDWPPVCNRAGPRPRLTSLFGPPQARCNSTMPQRCTSPHPPSPSLPHGSSVSDTSVWQTRAPISSSSRFVFPRIIPAPLIGPRRPSTPSPKRNDRSSTQSGPTFPPPPTPGGSLSSRASSPCAAFPNSLSSQNNSATS